jgi:uncharacterized membrane protein
VQTNRLEAFSDGVIAIIITIMVLELKPPHDPDIHSLLRIWPTFSAYVLSFIIIAIYWVNHHHLIHLVTCVDARILWANVNLLFWLSVVPWATVYLGDNHLLSFPVALYATVSTLGAVAFFILRHSIARHHREPEFKKLNRRMARKNLIGKYRTILWSSRHRRVMPIRLGDSAKPTLYCRSIGAPSLRMEISFCLLNELALQGRARLVKGLSTRVIGAIHEVDEVSVGEIEFEAFCVGRTVRKDDLAEISEGIELRLTDGRIFHDPLRHVTNELCVRRCVDAVGSKLIGR